MPNDKFSAVWVSHSSIQDFLSCPRAYYLKNIYKDPKTGHKIQLTSPALSLGQTVHEVIEALSVIKTADRFNESLLKKFDRAWKKVSGKKGGFFDADTEVKYKRNGEEMIKKVIANPGPLKKPAVKITQDLPYFWLSEKDNIILCGKVDWLEYLPDTDSVHIIDFKTSKTEEHDDSLQLPIYHLLVHYCQKRKVEKASYWYLRLHDDLTAKELPDLEKAQEQILQIAKKIKLARQLNVFKCPEGDKGCYMCRPMEKIIRGEAEMVGVGSYGRDIYVINQDNTAPDDSVIL